MTDSWEMRTNINNKPSAQGTLFQPTEAALHTERRWPRGYTPQRKREVMDALATVRIQGNTHAVWRRNGDEPSRKRFPETEARLTEAIARSTVPVEHLEGLRHILSQPSEGHRATYWPGARAIGIDMVNEPYAEQALIHEIGHHVDNLYTHESNATSLALVPDPKIPNSPFARQDAAEVREAKVRGIKEAVADNYYIRNYRGRRARKNIRPTQGLYEMSHTPEQLDERYPGYTDVRPIRTQPPEQDTLF